MKSLKLVTILLFLNLMLTNCGNKDIRVIEERIDETKTEKIKEHKKVEEGSQGFLWKVENKKNTIYLLGSFHAAKGNMYPLRQTILDSYEVSDYVFLETLNLGITEEEKKYYLNKIIYQGDRTLKDDISHELYITFSEALNSEGLETIDFIGFKPIIASQKYEAHLIQSAGYNYSQGIDMYFESKAMKDGKKLKAIEGVVVHGELFDSFSLELQEQILKNTLEKFSIDDIDMIYNAWIEGDSNLLKDVFHEEESFKIEEFYKKMLTYRDHEMAEKIVELLESDEGATYFIIVGAYHLILDEGIPHLLRQMGYEIIQI